MEIYLNGKSIDVASQNIAELHSELKLPSVVAIALNNKVVERSRWSSSYLSEGCRVTVIKAVCGG